MHNDAREALSGSGGFFSLLMCKTPFVGLLKGCLS